MQFFVSEKIVSPMEWYREKCGQAGFVSDAGQVAALNEIELAWQHLLEFKTRRDQFLGRSLLSPDAPKGMYLWGGVGCGKTLLMDGVYHCVPYRRKRRLHFHHFMIEVHLELKKLAHENDPLLALADHIADSTRLLCLDEFHVDDIADAMILGRLLEALFARGLVLLTTSNLAPDALYANGLQRQHFLPAIELIKNALHVIHLDCATDYRMLHIAREPLFLATENSETETQMLSLFQRLTAGAVENVNSLRVHHTAIPLRHVAREVVWFDFSELCGGNHDQSDYLAIAHRFSTVFLSGIPRFTADNGAEARRFTWLIDVLYDNHVKLVASFDVALEKLYAKERTDSESRRIASRLTEMQTRQYLELPHRNRGVSLTGKTTDSRANHPR